MELISNKPSCTVKAAVCPHLGFYPNGDLRHPLTGQPLKVKSLKEIVYSQLDIPEDREKGTSGCFFAIPYDRMYSIHDENIDFHSSGALFVDLDHVPEQAVENINNNFDKFIKFMPDLLGMNLSYSGTGFHIYFVSKPLSPKDYARLQIATCVRFSESYELIFNEKLPNTIFDPAQTGIKQRFFLNRPKDMQIQWNDVASIGVYSEQSLNDFVNKHIDYYNIIDKNGRIVDSIYKRWKNLTQKYEPKSNVTEQEWIKNSSITRKNNKISHLSHPERMRLYSSLRAAFNDDQKIVSQEWEHCIQMMEFLPEHKTQLKDALLEPDRNSTWKTYETPHISREFFLFYNFVPLKDTKCEDKEFEIFKDKEPNLTQEERTTLEKYL